MNSKAEPGAGRTTEKPLERYVRILEVISGFPEGVAASSIAVMLDLPKATAYRLIRGLAEVGLVEMTAPPSATCKLGSRLQRMLFAGASDEWLRSVSKPILVELSKSTGEACFMARFGGDVVRSMGMVAPNNLLRAHIVPGQVISINSGASAKAILAYQDEETIDRVFQPPLPRFTELTKTDPEELKRELAEIRRTGVAYCVGEDVDGFGAIAVPIIVPGVNVQLSIAVTGTIRALFETKQTSRLTEEIRTAAGKISGLLAEWVHSNLAAG